MFEPIPIFQQRSFAKIPLVAHILFHT
ncbi:hypothetical protein F383_37075 [Gossypium arboreum]|uniref:Uncharacterized protein n=1 Tax=Gossypium arboreum TaxID=29729 RepID=A0A0B0ME03_GOSAR|nr:hypothetical protein F383_37075 [Gossypium arboreum]